MFSNFILRFFSNFTLLLKLSGCAFLFNIFVYSYFKKYLGINISAIIAEISGSILLYFLLRFFRKAKLKKKRYGILIQSSIALVTLVINLMVLNILDWIINNSLLINYQNFFLSYKFTILSKFISSSIGFIWTSSMTMKFNFYFDKGNHLK